jgi:hypothetical protein
VLRSIGVTEPMRKFFIYDVNCDCCSYRWARSCYPKYGIMKCRFCPRRLGFMSFRFVGTVRAKGEFHALEVWKAKKNAE